MQKYTEVDKIRGWTLQVNWLQLAQRWGKVVDEDRNPLLCKCLLLCCLTLQRTTAELTSHDCAGRSLYSGRIVAGMQLRQPPCCSHAIGNALRIPSAFPTRHWSPLGLHRWSFMEMEELAMFTKRIPQWECYIPNEQLIKVEKQWYTF